MVNRIVNFFTSLRLTVVCLSLALLLVFIGTLAQVDQGLYAAQNRYFRSLLIYWSPKGADWRIPVLPGGYLLGGILLINLVAAHIKRFTFTKKKIGIFLIHAGLILLLLGQFATDLFQVESHMRLSEGEAKNYSENDRLNELVLIDSSIADHDQVVAIPETVLSKGKEIRHPQLPFTVQVKQYYPNSRLSRRAPMIDTEPPPATQGAGQQLKVQPATTTAKMDERNVPSAIVEIVTPQGSLGTWLVSGFLDELQSLKFDNRTYQVGLRLTRYYKPFYVELIKFSHDKYLGTDIPKNFSSRIRLRRAETGEDREVLIYMNNPLRYWGETYYQASFDPNDPRVTVLQVVRNPSWLTPYLSCALVALGLVVQFLSHLISFARKSSAKVLSGKAQGKETIRKSAKDRSVAEATVPVGPGGEVTSFPAGSKRRTL
jgi:ResB-like family